MNKPRRQSTRLVHAGNHPERHHGVMNTPTYRTSTVLFPTVASMKEGSKKRFDTFYYGRYGTPTTMALEEAVADLEGGYRSVSVSSGLSAIVSSLLSFLKCGDHLLMVDAAYDPTRNLCKGFLAKYGIETTFYDPLIGKEIENLISDSTKVIFTESPCSQTFEIQDIPAIAQVAHQHNIKVIMDNTWSAGYFFKPFDHGVDISIQAATKYISGHADVMIGMVTTKTSQDWEIVKRTSSYLGYCVGGDDAYLTSRGIRTLEVRLERHQENAIRLAKWFQKRPEVKAVLHPAFEDCPGHEIWKRDFSGASGLFGVVLNQFEDERISHMIDGMELFGIGFSWGAFESLMIPTYPSEIRSIGDWNPDQKYIRIHAGQEDPDDLIADLENGFERLNGKA